MTIDEMSHEAKVLLYCMGTLNSLVNKGLISQGRYGISLRGLCNFDQLEASGFRPTDAEWKMAMKAIQEMCAEGTEP